GRKARHKLPGIKHAKKPHAKAWGFFVCLLFAINSQASNQSEARPHGRAFCVFVPIQSVRTAKQQSICLFRQHKSLPYPPHHHISLYPRSGFSVNPENHATKKNVSLITYK
ncbi:TPA: hypothetical protein ACTZF8_004354, partial [Raoultella ornithinolytica]